MNLIPPHTPVFQKDNLSIKSSSIHFYELIYKKVDDENKWSLTLLYLHFFSSFYDLKRE